MDSSIAVTEGYLALNGNPLKKLPFPYEIFFFFWLTRLFLQYLLRVHVFRGFSAIRVLHLEHLVEMENDTNHNLT